MSWKTLKNYVLFLLWIQDHRSMRFGKLELQHLQNHVEFTKLSADSWGEPREACSLAAVKWSRVQNLRWLSRVVGCTSQCIGGLSATKTRMPIEKLTVHSLPANTDDMQADYWPDIVIETKVEILRTAIRSGINFIDNAEVYGAFPGESESIMGQAHHTQCRGAPKLANFS